MDENVWKEIMSAKVSVSVYQALSAIFEAFEIETDYEGEVFGVGSVVKMLSGKRLEITQEVELPLENDDNAASIVGNYDKATKASVYGSAEAIRRIVTDITTMPALSSFVGCTVYDGNKLIFIYGYC